MDKLIEEWEDFCKGKKDCNYNYFYTLFMEELSDEDIKRIFASFSHSQELTKRLKRLKDYSFIKVDNWKDVVRDLVSKDLKQKLSVLKLLKEDELINIIETSNIEFVEEQKYESLLEDDSSWPMVETMSLLGDYFRDSIEDYSKKISALVEAGYGATYNYNLVWYLIAPFLSVKYDFEHYVRLWELGARYTLTEKGVYIKSP